MKILIKIFTVLSVSVVMTSCLPSIRGAIPTPTSITPVSRSIAQMTDVESIWMLNDIYIAWNSHDITLDSFMGITCFLGDLGKRNLYKNFICLGSQDGQFMWAKETGIQSTITIAHDGIYVAYSSGAYLSKFDSQTGDLIWKKSLGGTGSIYLYYLDNQTQVSTTNPENLWVLDTNGKVVKTLKGNRTFVLMNDDAYVNLNGLKRIRATDPNQVVWEYIDTQRLRQAPLFTKDKIFLRNGDGFSGTAYALDRNNGTLLWSITNVIGNLVHSPQDQLVYALQEDGALLAIDENSGSKKEIVRFSNGSFSTFDGIDTSGYQLAYDNENHILTVYLGDSRQLFAFQEK